MRKWVVGLLVLTFLVTGSIGIYAKHNRFGEGPGDYYGPPSRFQERSDAAYIIHRTANTIFIAQSAADHGRRYEGLGLAIAHQQRARDLYWRGEYREAIYHSLRARDFAFQVMANNRERPRREYYFDDMEDHYVRSAPENNRLDVGVDTVKVGKGDSLVHLHFGLDISQ